MDAANSGAQERRRRRRFELRLPGSLEFDSLSNALAAAPLDKGVNESTRDLWLLKGTITNLSRGGACIEIRDLTQAKYFRLVREGRSSQVHIRCEYPDEQPSGRLSGRICWSEHNQEDSTACFGVEFLNLEPKAQGRLESHLVQAEAGGEGGGSSR